MDIFIDKIFNEYYQKHPLSFVDAGAGGGIQARWKPASKHLVTTGFEPDEREFKYLREQSADNLRYLNTALHNKQTEIEFFLTQRQTNSSIFPPNTPFLEEFSCANNFQVIGSTRVKADRLDSQLKQANISDVDLINADTQGSELFVLQGASGILTSSVFGVEVEVEFAPLYQEQPLFSDVDSFMRKQGFYLFDLRRIFWKRAVGKYIGANKGQLIFGEALYLKSFEEFAHSLTGKSIFEQKAKVLKAISICLMYHYFDYALAICERAYSETIFSASEKNLIFTRINNQFLTKLQEILPSFKGKDVIAGILYRLYHLMKFQPQDFREFYLGNFGGRSLGKPRSLYRVLYDFLWELKDATLIGGFLYKYYRRFKSKR
ncbi:FkbM family methyltransferase [Chloroflexota bacterium]